MYLPIILAFAFILSLLFSFLSLNKKLSAMEIVNDMGLGWNLGNSFDCYNTDKKFENPDEVITLWGNQIPKKEIFIKIKKYGFKTIRVPVTWMTFMDSSNNVNSEWMKKVKEVVDWIININMYCILNIHHDGANGNWLSQGVKAKEKYVKLWGQIAEEFKNYDEHLIFESMNNVEYMIGNKYDFESLVILTQSFVDVIRNSGGSNKYRLLLISGANALLELTSSPEYKMPFDPYNKLGVSLHYYYPTIFAIEKDDDPYTWIDENDNVNIVTPMTEWGSESQYKDMFSNFETMKKIFVDNGLPVVIAEVGVLTEQKKEKESIRKYLHAQFSMSSSYNGIMSCLWDTSNGDMRYYDRGNDKWYDNIIKDIFKNISKGKYVNPREYYFISNKETVMSSSPEGPVLMTIGEKKPKKIIFNAYVSATPLYNAGFGVVSSDKNGNWVGESVAGNQGQKQYDGSYTFTMDANEKDYNDYIQIEKWWGHNFTSFNYLTIEFENKYTFFDYNEYMKHLTNLN